MTTKKYELLKNDTLEVDGHTLYRIRALCNFGNICEFEEGGYIEGEHNLSHEGDAWVGGDALVYHTAFVSGNAKVEERAWVFDDALVTDNALIYGHAQVYGDASVRTNAKVTGHAQVYGKARIADRALITNTSRIFGTAFVDGTACVRGGQVYGSAVIRGNAEVQTGAEICGTAVLGGYAIVRRCGEIKPFVSNSDSWMTFNNVGSENGVLTVYLATNGAILCTRGCFTGTIEDFLHAVKQEHRTNHIAQEYALMIQVAKLRLMRVANLSSSNSGSSED